MINKRNYTGLDMLRFSSFREENNKLSKLLLLKAYEMKYGKKTDKEFLGALSQIIRDSERSVKINKNITFYQTKRRFYFTLGYSRDKKEEQQRIIELHVAFWSIEIHW